jgi:hypothetical protein
MQFARFNKPCGRNAFLRRTLVEENLQISRPDNGYAAISLSQLCGESERCVDIIKLKRRVMLDNLRGREPLRQRVENRGDSNVGGSDKRFARTGVGIYRYSREQFFISHAGTVVLVKSV